LDVGSSVPKGAVFLSYASQDAEAAKRIADALRAAGVEVWFDQNELVGGDAWDQKIRGQIGSCALFVPIVSANTQARLEGYFRREWKQAAARTQDMADEKTFLLPVVIDDTRDAHAKVPPEFKAVQWTRLAGGETPPAFVARVKKLLGDEPGAAEAAAATPRLQPAAPSRRRSRLWWLAPIFGVAMALLLLLRDRTPAPMPTPAPTVPASTSADALVAKARALLDDPLMTRANVELAEQLGLEALAKEPMNAEANALLAWTNYQFLFENYDKTPQRLADLKKYADKALLLAPDSINAELAACGMLVMTREYDDAFRRLQALADRAPDNLLVLRTWAWATIWGRGATWGVGRDDEHPAMPRLRAISPLGRAYADSFAAGRAWGRGKYAEADRLIDGVFASGQPVRLTYLVRLLVLTFGWGDLPAAREFAKTIPPKLLLEDVFINHVSTLWLHSGEFDQALDILKRASRPMLHEARVVTPTAELRARALSAAGRTAAAALQWNESLKLVGEQLERDQDNDDLRASRVVALARLGDLPAARKEFALVEELRKAVLGNIAWAANVDLAMEVGDREGAIARLDRAIATDNPRWPNTYNLVRYDPLFAPLLADTRVQAILARGEKWLAAMRAKSAGGDSAFAKASAVAGPMADKTADEKSVAVLAFANLSDDKANEYFSDGISEELLNVLAKVPGLKVSARTSAFYFKGKEVPVPEIAKQLGVAYVVEGSVRKAGDKVRITAQLIKAADGFHVWSDTFTRELKDIFAVQDEIAGLIARNLEVKLAASTKMTAPVNPEAYRLYLEGRQILQRRTLESYDRAEQLFQQARAIAPRWPSVYAGLADCARLRAFGSANSPTGPDLPWTADMLAAKSFAEQALALDPDLAEAYVSLAGTNNLAWNFAEAERLIRRALELNPNDAEGYLVLGRLMAAQGRIDESLAALRRATDLNPLAPRMLDNLSWQLRLAGRLDEAWKTIERAYALQPDSTQIQCFRAHLLARMGRREEALEQARSLVEDRRPEERDFRLLEAARVYRVFGRQADAEALLAQISPGASEQTVGLAYVGRPAEAIPWLHQLVFGWIGDLLSAEDFDPIRTDPRLHAYLERTGLVEAHARAQAWRAAHGIAPGANAK
jgi:TolB-like protein/Flp pilus assembly protein TadD